jgi:hypothetical protein
MRAKINCVPGLMAPSSSASPDKLESCANAVTGASCDTLYTHDTPSACKSDPGKLMNGAACGDDAQCTSTYCKKASGQVCGVCGMRASAGGACSVEADCDYKLTCANMLCVAFGAAGATCDSGHPCAPPNVCRAGTCATGATAGQACDPAGKECDPTQPLYCPATSRVCTTVTFVGGGQACGLVNGGYVGCSGGARCKLGAGFMGTCLAPAADGAACDTTNGPDCLAPAQCVGSVCKLPNPASCT